jgi:hypothetical protein
VNKARLSGATHLSIVWGIALAIMTIIEWNSLDRDPLNHQILSPFIQRDVTVSVEPQATVAREADIPELEYLGVEAESPDAVLRYDVALDFNGPLFLACFFVPVAIFHGVGILWRRVRGRPE